MHGRGVRFGWLLLSVWMVAVGGCASRRLDWNTRIGSYTYDDAVRELGPPDKSAVLTDKSMVADWMTGRGAQVATTFGGGWGAYGRYPYGFGGPGVVVMDQPSPDRYLRLTFGPEGKLASWERIYK